MKRLTHLYLACLLTAGWSLPLLAGEENTMPQSFFEKSIHGRAVQIDPGFAYYQDRSAESIASEVAMNGFECVHLILLDERKGDHHELINTLHRWGIAVVYMPFISGVYQDADLFPPDAEKWKMQFLNSVSPYRFYSFVHRDFAEWTRERLKKVLAQYPFDGITFPETHYPISLDTLDRPPGEVDYVDVSPAFQKAFQDATGHSGFPDFNNPDSTDYFRTNQKLYHDLVEFRTQTIVAFFDRIVNGEQGLRARFPDISIGLWSIGISTPDFAELLNELEGDDPAKMAAQVRPDIYYIQTHWPDWVRGDLPPDYVHSYVPFLEAVRKAVPNLPVAIQFDVGSQYQMVKSQAWYEAAVMEARRAGFESSTYYEFSLRGAIYFDVPQLKQVMLLAPHSLRLDFDQRLDPQSVASVPGRQITEFLSDHSYTIQSATVDGNILILTTEQSLLGTDMLSFPLGGLSDMPSIRFDYPHWQENVPDRSQRQGRRNSIPENMMLYMRVTTAMSP